MSTQEITSRGIHETDRAQGTTRRTFLKASTLTCLATLGSGNLGRIAQACTFQDGQGLPIYWNGWNVLTDNGANLNVSTFSKKTPAAVVARDSSHLDVFVVGNDSRIWTRSCTIGAINTTWSSWLPIGSGTFSTATPLAVVSRDSSHIDVFVIGNDSNLWTAEWNGSVWGGWVQIGGPFSNLTQAAAIARDASHIDLFVLGTDSKLYTMSWNGSAWSGWTQITGGPFSSKTPPVVVARDANHLDVFVVGNDSRLWTNSWDSSGWNGWVQVPGGTFSNKTAPAVVARDSGHIDVFVIGNDNRIWTAEWYGSWGNWSLISDNPSDPNVSTFSNLTPPSVVARGADQLNLYVMGNDSRIWSNAWNVSEWCGWQPVSDNPFIAGVSTFSNATPPFAISRDSEHVDLFVIGNDSRVWRDTWGPPAVAVYVPLSTRRICQETSNYDPTGLPHINDTTQWDVTGTDMGCPVEFNNRLYFLFGDCGPSASDPICYTTDSTVGSAGIHLSCVLNSSGTYRPLTVTNWGTLPADETPTGAFSYNGLLYAFIVWSKNRDPNGPFGTLTSTSDPSQNFDICYDISDSSGNFWQIAPWVINNADYPGLPSSTGDGLLMWGQRFNQVYLAWMPLTPGVNPPPASGIRYYAGNGTWSANQADGVVIFSNLTISQISVTWLAGPQKWLFLYTNADTNLPHESIVARIGTTPWDWSDEIPLFNPDREGAWGKYMHMPGADNLYTLPPGASDSLTGYAYSPFCLNRYTSWNATTKVLTIYYLMATFVPYQVMLMTSQIQF